VDNRTKRPAPVNDLPMHDLPDPDWYLDHVVVPSGTDRSKVGPVRRRRGEWDALAYRLRTSADESPLGGAVRLALRQGFVLTREQALCCGMTSAQLRGLLRRGEWTRTGHGTVAVVPTATGDVREAARRRHALAASSAVLRRPDSIIGAASAAVLHGVPVLEVPRRPQLVAERSGDTGRRQAVDVRTARLAGEERAEWFGAPALALPSAVVDLARHDPRSGLMAADAALHEQLLRASELATATELAANRRGIRRAREVLALASPLIESPLESLTHLALHDARFPPPDLQVYLRGADRRRYRVDFFWPEQRLVLEADGRDKYGGNELWREKARDIALSRAGYRVERVRWIDVVDQWPATSAWLSALLLARR
jgi:hypothetical protein